jgi:hypothetical protein
LKKLILVLITFYISFNTYACTDVEADNLVQNRAIEMAKRYSAKNVGIGVSIIWNNLRATTITIPNGDAGNGEKMDRIGSIYIDMDTCIVKAKLIGAFDLIEVK